MSTLTLPPPRRGDLILSPAGHDGSIVVKDPRSGKYFRLGEQEAFLLARLDGEASADDVCTAYSRRFEEPLSAEELDGFVQVARQRGLVQTEGTGAKVEKASAEELDDDEAALLGRKGEPFNLMNWRLSLYDPDRLFTWLAPKLAFLWTPAFVV